MYAQKIMIIGAAATAPTQYLEPILPYRQNVMVDYTFYDMDESYKQEDTTSTQSKKRNISELHENYSEYDK